MRILVCGGREFSDWRLLAETLDALNLGPDDIIITGKDPDKPCGADDLADRWAKWRGVSRVLFPPNWTGQGKAGGPKRNARMLEIARPDRVVAFPGGRGTADMMEQADRAGVPVTRA